MYRQFGSSALLFLVFSAFVSNLGPGAARLFDKDKSSKEEPAAKPEEAKPADAIDADVHRCAVAEILRRHYGESEDTPLEKPDGAIPEFVCGDAAFQTIAFKDDGRGRVMIATVPDPLQTANVLEFDRDIEALQEAASTSGYDFESIFTEWDLSSLEEPKDAKGGRAAEHYRRLFGDAPGAMLFHCRPPSNKELIRRLALSNEEQRAHPAACADGETLLLVLVPESPTYGLNMHAAREALHAVRELTDHSFVSGAAGSSYHEVLWIGPNYSASVSGLEELAQSSPLNAFSGSITSRTGIDALQRIDCSSRARDGVGGKFASPVDCGLHDDDVTASVSDENVFSVLRNSGVLGLKNSIAVLQEDESSYGSGELFVPQPDGRQQPVAYEIRTFHFPRGISHVRRVFGSQYTNYKPTTGEAPARQDPKSMFDLGDTLQQPLDTAPEFSEQSPYSNEGVLAAVASSIEHMKASAVVILASDPLDNLFLARYLREKIPDIRIVLFGAERFVPDLRGQYDLDGILTVTRFPLFDDSYLEAPGVARHSLSFMNSTQEGIFFAALHQIYPYPVFEATTTENAFETMPVWIGVSSGGSFWPLRHGESSAPFSVKTSSYVVRDVPPEPLPRLWRLSVMLVLVCAAFHFVLFLAGQPLNAKISESPKSWGLRPLALHRLLTFYLPCAPCAPSGKPHEREFNRELGRRFWMFSATGQLGLVLNFLLLPAARLVWTSNPHPSLDVETISLGLVCAVVLLMVWGQFVCLWVDLRRFYRERPQAPRHADNGGMPFVTLLWIAGSLTLFAVKVLNPADGWVFSLRCVHLASGVSPSLPPLLASLGFITAAVVNLEALALARDRNPHIPQVGLDPLQLAPCDDELAKFIECWGALPSPQGGLLFLFVAVWLLAVQPCWQLFGSLDGWVMTTLFALDVAFSLWTIAWLWVRFLAIWNRLRFVLEALEGSPLRFAFSRLPKVFSLAPIWSYAGLRRTVILPMRWFEYLRVSPRRPDDMRYRIQERREQALVDGISLRLFHDQVLIDGSYIQFSRDQNAYAATLAQIPAVAASWRRGGPDAEIDGAGVVDHDGIKSRTDLPAPCIPASAADCTTAIANEYIAMRFGAYIRYVTLHLKNLMTFMSLGLLLFLLAAVSYPFREPRGIAWSMIVLVVILLIGVGAVLIQMDRDSILSRMSETQPGKVDRGAFLWHMLSVGGLPVITALSALFPSIGNVLFAWLQPLLGTFH